MVGVGQQVVDHNQLGQHLGDGVMPAAGGDGVDQDKRHEAHDHHLQQFQVMIAHKLPSTGHSGAISGNGGSLILLHQTVGTEEEEHRDAVVTEERQQMHREIDVGMAQHLVEHIHIVAHEGVFVLLDNGAEPVAEVVEEDANDGHTSQYIALGTGEQGLG